MKLPLSSMFFCVLFFCAGANMLLAQKKQRSPQDTGKSSPDLKSKAWELVFCDEFNKAGSIDDAKWSYCPRSRSSWSKFLTATQNYAFVDGGNLVLKMDDRVINGDPVPYHSGGIQTSKKFSFGYGKVEVRAQFKQGQGSWPAIWMMPEQPVSYGTWPSSGEMDIMEHVNNEPVIHQTIHNSGVTDADGQSSATHSGRFQVGDFNTYGIIWTPISVQFYINGVLTYGYSKAENATSRDWPFDKAFYLILNQSGGAGWPGPITNADLPFIMKVDWVRVYKRIGDK